jgi:hypothetical protein
MPHLDSRPPPSPVLQIQELSKAGVTQLSAGGWHSGAVTAGGLVYVWGRGEHGRLGLGDVWRDRLRPAELHLAARAAQLSCGGTHTVVVTEDGVLLSCGRQSFGRLGRSSAGNPNVPLPVELPPPPPGAARWLVEAASAGGRHTLALCRPVAAAKASEQVIDGKMAVAGVGVELAHGGV